MEQKPSNIILSGLSLCLRILMWDTRIKGFLSFLLFCFHFAFTHVSQNYKAWTKTRNNCANSEPVLKQRNLELGCTQSGVRLCREEVILVMEKLGMNSVQWDDADGLGEELLGVHEIGELFEKEITLVEVEEAFDVFDQNKDGFIEARELQRVLSCLGWGKDLKECQRMINVVDENGDELIDLNEFVRVMEQSFG